VSKHWRK